MSATTIQSPGAEVKDGMLVIRLPLCDPRPSKSGKTLIVASTEGPMPTGCLVAKMPVKVNVSAWINVPAKDGDEDEG